MLNLTSATADNSQILPPRQCPFVYQDIEIRPTDGTDGKPEFPN